jgi:5-formyltetrahydrofolate cyclo-ligase
MNQPHDPRKADIRARMRRLLASIDDARRVEASASAAAHLVNLEEFRRASIVMLYMALPDEIDLAPAADACFRSGKSLCVPRVDWKHGDMDPVEVTSFDEQAMRFDERGLRVPREGAVIAPERVDLVAVPGLAFDPGGNRLGRGGGFYDRFLRRLRASATRVGIAFDGQVVDSVPVSERDLGVDIVVTDRRIAYAGCRRAGPSRLAGHDTGSAG